MPRARRTCGHRTFDPGGAHRTCPYLATAVDGLCDLHRREREQARGSATARGYDAAHAARRVLWAGRLARGVVVACWRCGEPVRAGDDWHLGHDDDGTERGPEHAACNTRAAALKGHGLPWRPPDR